MSKIHTHHKTYLTLLEDTLNDLFSPKSKNALLDYKQLKLINTKDLDLINLTDLNLIDSKSLQLLNLGILAIFFQYVGALFLTMSLGFMVAFGAFTVHNSLNTTVFAMGEPQRNETLAYQINESEVLGVSTDRPAESCSFSVKEATKTVRYADGGKYIKSGAAKVCVDTNQAASGYSWELNGVDKGNGSDCLTTVELKGVRSLTVSVLDGTANPVASCVLNISSSN